MKRKTIFIALILFLCIENSFAQREPKPFTHADTLRGSITPERAWWDVLRYDIIVKPDYGNKTIKGSNEIKFHVLSPGKIMQIDLQEPLKITSVLYKKL